jgi:hypothetical protein
LDQGRSVVRANYARSVTADQRAVSVTLLLVFGLESNREDQHERKRVRVRESCLHSSL